MIDGSGTGPVQIWHRPAVSGLEFWDISLLEFSCAVLFAHLWFFPLTNGRIAPSIGHIWILQDCVFTSYPATLFKELDRLISWCWKLCLTLVVLGFGLTFSADVFFTESIPWNTGQYSWFLIPIACKFKTLKKIWLCQPQLQLNLEVISWSFSSGLRPSLSNVWNHSQSWNWLKCHEIKLVSIQWMASESNHPKSNFNGKTNNNN